MQAPTTPVPGKERITSRSTLGSAGVAIMSLVEPALDFVEATGANAGYNFDTENIIGLGISAAIFAVGYLRDVAMAFIEAKATAAGVNFEHAKQESRTMRRFADDHDLLPEVPDNAQ